MIKIKRKSIRRHPAPARPSRIRRDPALASKGRDFNKKNAWWNSKEWETRFAVIGITFFALAISAVVIDVGEVLGR